MIRSEPPLNRFFVSPDYSVYYRRAKHLHWQSQANTGYSLLSVLKGKLEYNLDGKRHELTGWQSVVLEPNVSITATGNQSELLFFTFSASLVLQHATTMRLIPPKSTISFARTHQAGDQNRELIQPKESSACCSSASARSARHFIAGVEAIKKGLAEPIGSLTQMGNHPSGQAHRQPRAEDQGFRPARRPERHRLRRVGHLPRLGLRSRAQCRRARERTARATQDANSKIKPMKAVFDQTTSSAQRHERQDRQEQVRAGQQLIDETSPSSSARTSARARDDLGGLDRRSF
jgi:hypothetical protein